MDLKDYRYDGSNELKLDKVSMNEKKNKAEKAKYLAKTKQNQLKIAELQDKMFAQGEEGVIFVLQARDAAGKDSTVKHIMTGINPQGVDVYGFKQPSKEDLSHDFMWRFYKCLPPRGKIAIFNRSYYEDVLVVKVHQLNKTYKMPKRCLEDGFFKRRYEHILNYERMLYDNGYRFIKVFLNVSKEKQKERFLERIDLPEKNWKFSSADLAERGYWDEYTDAYEKAINHTASKECPWYVVPADQKWYARYIISEIILDCMKDMKPEYPELSKDEVKKLEECKVTLNSEGKKKSEKKDKDDSGKKEKKASEETTKEVVEVEVDVPTPENTEAPVCETAPETTEAPVCEATPEEVQDHQE